MNRFKTAALFFAVTVMLTACDQESGKTEVAAPPTARGGGAAPQFAVLTSAETVDVIKVPCALDKINGQSGAALVNIEAGHEIRFGGWVSDHDKRVPDRFTIVLTGPATYGVAGTAGIGRPDVARALNSEALAKSGFNVLATLGPVAAGEYAVSIIEDAGGTVGQCTTKARIAVVNSPS